MTAPTSSDIDDIWAERIWNHATVLAMTSRHFSYDVSDDAAFQVADLIHETPGEMPAINFFLCLVQRRQDPNQAGGGGAHTRYSFQVRVEYYLQQTDAAAETHRLHRDRLEAVDDLVRSSLGAKWGSTVDFWQGGVPLPVTKVTIDDRACWKGGYTYTAVKTT